VIGHVLGLIALWLVLIGAVFLIPFGVAGTFLITLATFVYAWATGFEIIGWNVVFWFLGISVAVEVVEFVVGGWAARRAGSSRWGFWGAIVGGFLGALWMTPVLPLIGSLAGALVGAFVGAAVFEYIGQSDVRRALRAGWGAFLGAASGKILKLLVAIGMDVYVAYVLLS